MMRPLPAGADARTKQSVYTRAANDIYKREALNVWLAVLKWGRKKIWQSYVYYVNYTVY